MQEKAGLYQVEAADELSMILHVINTAEEKRLLFIVDSQGRTFHNQANLRIIKEYAWIENESLLSSQTARCSRTSAGN